MHVAKSYLELSHKIVEVNNNIVSRIKISESLTILQNSTTTLLGKLDSFLREHAENMTFEPNYLDDVGVVISKLILKTNQSSFSIPIVNISEDFITLFKGQTI